MLMAFFTGCLIFYLNKHISSLSSRTGKIILASVILYSALVTALVMKGGYAEIFGHWDRVMPLPYTLSLFFFYSM